MKCILFLTAWELLDLCLHQKNSTLLFSGGRTTTQYKLSSWCQYVVMWYICDTVRWEFSFLEDTEGEALSQWWWSWEPAAETEHSELTALCLLYVNHCRIMLSWGKAAACHTEVCRDSPQLTVRLCGGGWAHNTQNDSELLVQVRYVRVYLHFFLITGRLCFTNTSAINPNFSYCLRSCWGKIFVVPVKFVSSDWQLDINKGKKKQLHKLNKSQGTNTSFDSRVM